MATTTPAVPSSSQSIVGLGVTQNPSLVAETAASAYPVTLNRHGDLQVAPVHGSRYVSAYNNNLWRISSGTAGASILAAGGTTSGFAFGNLAASGVNMEVHRVRVVPLTATAVVGVIGLEYGVAPVSTTYVTGVVGSPVGNGATPLCKAWSAVTIIANAWVMALPYFVPATTNINQPGIEMVFDGGLVIGPGFAINVAATASQAGNKSVVEIDWSEWPI